MGVSDVKTKNYWTMGRNMMEAITTQRKDFGYDEDESTNKTLRIVQLQSFPPEYVFLLQTDDPTLRSRFCPGDVMCMTLSDLGIVRPFLY